MGEAILSFLVLIGLLFGALSLAANVDKRLAAAFPYRIYKVEGGALVACKAAQLTECGLSLTHCENGAKLFCLKSVTEVK